MAELVLLGSWRNLEERSPRYVVARTLPVQSEVVVVARIRQPNLTLRHHCDSKAPALASFVRSGVARLAKPHPSVGQHVRTLGMRHRQVFPVVFGSRLIEAVGVM